MAYNLLWNGPKVLEDFISLGRELQINEPLYAKQFWPFLDFNLGGLKLKFELRKVLPVMTETVVNCSARYTGASAFNALYTMPQDSHLCLLVLWLLPYICFSNS